MKEWVKEMIKKNRLGYLSLSNRSDIFIIPFVYSYDRGHLKGSLSIVHDDLITILSKYPLQHILITDDQHEIGITGTIHLDSTYLDDTWKNWANSNDLISDNQTLKLVESIPHLQKRVIIDFTPTKIEATDGEEKINYEMEIV